MANLDELILFDTEFGRYKITRRERRRLAILHHLTDASAAALAHGAPGFPGHPSEGFSADYLAGMYDDRGRKHRTDMNHVAQRGADAVVRAGRGHG